MPEEVARVETPLDGEISPGEPEFSLSSDFVGSDPLSEFSLDDAYNMSFSSEENGSLAVNLPSIAEHIAPVFVTLLSCPIRPKANLMASITFSR